MGGGHKAHKMSDKCCGKKTFRWRTNWKGWAGAWGERRGEARPAQCLAACHYERCRSANLIQMEDKQKVCELFRDSIVEWRRNDVLSFDRLAVHFDSIQCQR
uniref:Apple domain-containing protein n=1 Tax=Globodera pallida TaxID=36090 RepID=A0A183BNL7_GLOPA